MFFQETTPDTSGYMIAGYAISFIVMALYVASIYVRNRNLNQDMTTLQELDKPVQQVRPQPKKNPARAENNKSAKTVTKKSRKKQA